MAGVSQNPRRHRLGPRILVEIDEKEVFVDTKRVRCRSVKSSLPFGFWLQGIAIYYWSSSDLRGR
jgi:hypothetical protein